MAVETLRPNAPGDECNIQNVTGCSSCPNHYTCVDEASADDGTTYIRNYNESPMQRDLYNIDDHSVGSGTINKITVYSRCRDNGFTGKLKICIKSGTGSGAPDTVSEGAEKSMTGDGTWANYSEEWATNPATGSAWTWDEIDKLQIGVAMGAKFTECYCTQVYVEVDYTAVTEKTSSDSGSGSDARLSGSPLALMSKADSGSGVEGTPAPEATLTGSETGSGIEKLLNREVILSDAGSGFENSHLDIVMSAKSSSDAGSGAEESGLLATFEQGETGSGNESLLSRVLSQPDSGGGSEATSALLAALINTETGSGIDLVLSRLMITSETGSGVEKLPKREVLLSDAASGIEAATTLKALLATDSGAGLEALVGLRALITNEEAGYGSERLGVRIMTATGTSNMKLLDKKGKARIPSRKVDL